jgi:catechol-2,3-dioxygenase
MHISELHLKTRNLSKQKDFYQITLGLPVLEERATSFTFQAGTTRLTFHASSQNDIIYHFAFTVPRNKLALAKKWLVERTPLLSQNGQDDFDFGSPHSTYFLDAAGNIGELIAHHSLLNETPGNFTSSDLLHVSEIGLVVDDVDAQVAALHTRFGLELFKPFGAVAGKFAAVGDALGLFIVVKTGRTWFPTSTPATVAPLDVTINGISEKNYRALPYPYTIRTATLVTAP